MCRKSFCVVSTIYLYRFHKIINYNFRGRCSILKNPIIILHPKRNNSNAMYCVLYTLYSPIYVLYCYTPPFTLLAPHSTLYTPHYTFHTRRSTIYNLNFTLYILYCEIYTSTSTSLFSKYHTLYCIILRALHIRYFTHYTSHSTLQISHSALHTLPTAHSTLNTLHSAFIILHPALYTPPHSTLYTLHTFHSTLHTLLDNVALGDVDSHFAWQAWRLTSSTSTLRGRRGAFGTGLALVAHLVPV